MQPASAIMVTIGRGGERQDLFYYTSHNQLEQPMVGNIRPRRMTVLVNSHYQVATLTGDTIILTQMSSMLILIEEKLGTQILKV